MGQVGMQRRGAASWNRQSLVRYILASKRMPTCASEPAATHQASQAMYSPVPWARPSNNAPGLGMTWRPTTSSSSLLVMVGSLSTQSWCSGRAPPRARAVGAGAVAMLGSFRYEGADWQSPG